MHMQWIRLHVAFLMLSVAATTWPAVAAVADGVRSPDGRYAARIVETGHGDENGSGAQVLVLLDEATGKTRRLLVSRWSDDAHRNLSNLSDPLFSADGTALYVTSSDAAPTSGAVHRIDLKTGAIGFVHTGQALGVVRTGRYRGFLLVQVHRYHDRPSGGSYNPVILVRPNGRDVLVIPRSERDDGEAAVAPWLARHGWRAS